MAKRETWFGTMGHERWIPTPAINPDYSRTGFSSSSQYLNGGAGVRDSKSAHNVYVLSWGAAKSRDAVRKITDFADGVFDEADGIELIYWIDPMAADLNVLPQGWAFPAQASEDGVPLIEDSRPKAVPTSINDLYYPARSAQYTIKASSKTLTQYVPIPPGHAAWVGIHGEVSAAGRIRVQPMVGRAASGSPVVPTVLAVTDSTLVNTSFSSASYSGIRLELTPVVSDTVFTVSGMIVQILPIGQAPLAGEYISGQGHSGCQFVGKPQKTPYSAALDMVGATARLEETGAYL